MFVLFVVGRYVGTCRGGYSVCNVGRSVGVITDWQMTDTDIVTGRQVTVDI